MAKERVQVVVFAGPPESGKTTVLASIYESFLAGSIQSWSFAGSSTLLGFGMRAFWSSTSSGRSFPSTQRTRYDMARPWLHLRLSNDHGPQPLLIADISGEYFGTVASGGGLAEAEELVRRADHIVHVVDCALLVDPRERLRALTAAEGLIRRLAEGRHFNERASHSIVLTKADLCAKEVTDIAQSRAKAWSSRWLNDAPVIEVAARPADHSEAWGLSDLLDCLTGTAATPTAAANNGVTASPITVPALRIDVAGLSEATGQEDVRDERSA